MPPSQSLPPRPSGTLLTSLLLHLGSSSNGDGSSSSSSTPEAWTATGQQPLQQCEVKPLATPASAPREVFAFDPPRNQSDWLQMDWGQLTTLALSDTHVATASGHPWPPQMDLYCHAHAHHVKIVHCVTANESVITDDNARSAWVAAQVSEALRRGTDGVNVDVENFSGQKDDLTALVADLYSAFKLAIPTSQVSFDADVFPGMRNKLSYDYPSLAAVVDFFVPMAYDMRAPPHQLANSPYAGLQQSVEGFAAHGVHARQLVIALPW
jgi:hypothetical protein